ncbi:MAG: hypothetical protein JSU95_04065 [Betaproteobacteria bacterium]|nr:MAG: hypothetical protein JSU95_04065 [Betaproteobacteria bacterium]
MRWQKGESGNPGGRPKGYGDLRQLCMQHTEESVQVLLEVMRDTAAPATARCAAAEHVLSRGWGKASVAAEEYSGGGLVEALRQLQARRA